MTEEPLNSTFAALADPTRRAILLRLSAGKVTLNELAEPLGMTPQAVSKHLQVLQRAGLITRNQNAQYRTCRLETEPLDDAAAWITQFLRTIRPAARKQAAKKPTGNTSTANEKETKR